MATAHIFTGQGFALDQVNDYSDNPHLDRIDDAFRSRFGYALPRPGELTEAIARRNEVSAAILLLSALRMMAIARDRLAPPVLTAGYSVGQYLALCYAGALTSQDTIDLVLDRCRIMNEAAADGSATLIASIGAGRARLQELLAESDLSHSVTLANDNAVGNYSFAVARERVGDFIELCKQAGAFRIVNLETDGGWHSPFLNGARRPFGEALKRYDFREPHVATIDNTYVSSDGLHADRIRETLVEHLVKPVRWRETIKTFAEAGVTEVVELTDFDLLTRMSTFTAPKIRFLIAAKACAA